MKRTTLVTLAVFAALALAGPAAFADTVVSEAGTGAGRTSNPQGLAVDFETGRLYVADQANNRIDVFGPTGAFLFAFGWGVDTGAPEAQTCTTASSCNAGTAGSGSGQLSAPDAIAVDNDPASPSFHDIYVTDFGNRRIEKFSHTGEFILALGGGVDKTVPGNICTAASGHICGAGANGTGSGEFSSVAGSSIPVAVGPGGTVYMADSHFKNGSSEAGGIEGRVQELEPSGSFLIQHLFGLGRIKALAVASTGSFYVAKEGAERGLRKYDASANLLSSFPSDNLAALALDSADDLYVAEGAGGTFTHGSIVEYDAAGNALRRFGYGSFEGSHGAQGLAPLPIAGGGAYASESVRVIQIPFPSPGPIVFPQPCSASPIGNTKATLNAEVNPEGKATTVHYQYLTQAQFEAGGFANPATKTTAESESVGSDFDLHKAGAVAEVLPETKYHCRAIATNPDDVATGPDGSFTSKQPFEILETWSIGMGFETATLNATVNPLGVPTNGHFEYVEDATYQHDVAESGPGHGFDHATRAPAAPEELDFGAGEAPKTASALISGLAPGTAYRYRIVVDDHLIPPRSGPAESFRTFAPGEGALPDGRAYELVSPAQKNSAEVGVPGRAGGLFLEENVARIQAAAGSGEAIAYTSWSSFGNAEGAPATSQYLSKRGPSGWSTENVSPFGLLKNPTLIPLRGFSVDLGFAAVAVSEPPLTPDAQEGFENLYLRDNATGTLRALTTEAPQFTPVEAQVFNHFCTGYAGASADGRHAIFAADGAMAGAPTGVGFSLYEWSQGEENLGLVSVLPDGSPAAPAAGTAFGNPGAVGGACTMDQRTVRHAISEDGSVIFWTYGGKYKSSEKPLLARIDGTETIQLDAKVAGEKNGGRGTFWAATGDGSKAFFTAPGKLTSDAKAEGQLYRYETGERTLADLTPGTVDPEVEGVIGASEDGAYVYFVAKGALSGEEESAAGEKALQGANNLYLWHEGEGLRFIAALAELDESDWDSAPSGLTARLSPDGRHLAFLSLEAKRLSGYDNTIVGASGCELRFETEYFGDPRCAEAYLYGAEADTLACASCNPSGARPIGPAALPSWSNPYEGPRYLSDDGSRLFFESRDALSGGDENHKRDVYQFEYGGAGSCTSQGASFDPASGGCLSLISTGKSLDESFLLDASADGRDVFFSTRQALVGWDTNDNFDVYDARAGGGFPGPSVQAPPCEGEACRPSTSLAPISSAPGTPSFQGPGNAVEKPKAKKHKHKKKKHGRANHGGRGRG
jgi:DNA-binding beta-propeller fold protein YncE